jgi:Cytoskeletal-regulatory complex EF hand
MNYGGSGGGGGGMPPYGGGMPAFPMYAMPPQMPGPMPVQQHMPMQQHPHHQMQGYGPLGEAPMRMGANGLYLAPEPEGPEEHEGMQYLKLNPGEAVRYDALWAEASAGVDAVGGKEASMFLSRAAKVSKTQLRLIWEICDHRVEGRLDRSQFLIALRLLAIAQRGAEISVKGLRNFVGIQLIPNIKPAPSAVAEEPAPSALRPYSALAPNGTSAVPGSGPGTEKEIFSWTVPPDVMARYDAYFASLDSVRSGFVAGHGCVTFFGKSGLNRPTLKKVWQLADITRDGKLDLSEFRNAMHLVANLRSNLISAADLPKCLDPSGPNWVRLPKEEQQNQRLHESRAVDEDNRPQQSPPAIPGATPNVMDDDDMSYAVPPPPRPADDSDLLGGIIPSVTRDTRSPQRKLTGVEEAARADMEMEIMKAELERLRLEKEMMSTQTQKQQSVEVEQMRKAYADILAAKNRAEHDAARAHTEAERLKTQLSKTNTVSSSFASHVPPSNMQFYAEASSDAGRGTTPTPSPSPTSPSARPTMNEPLSPPTAASPKSLAAGAAAPVRMPAPVANLAAPVRTSAPGASAPAPGRMSAPAASVAAPGRMSSPEVGVVEQKRTSAAVATVRAQATKLSRLASDDSMSESDDDEDFWGAGGVGAKPTLGGKDPPGAEGSSAGGGGTALDNGFGNGLDEWAF